jgi:two-component system, NtrC family, response regulator AtoC
MTQTARRMLIVEDDGLVRENVVLFCERLGFDVTSCATVASALQYAATDKYGVVLVDCLLPDGNGMKVLEEMSQYHPEVSLVMMTGSPSVEAVIKCLRLGAIDYVIKPFNLFEMKSILERAAQKHTAALNVRDALRLVNKDGQSETRNGEQNRGYSRRQFAEPEFGPSGEKY